MCALGLQYWRLIDPEGNAPGLLGWWPSKACTFVDNHDTGDQGCAFWLLSALEHPSNVVTEFQLRGSFKVSGGVLVLSEVELIAVHVKI